MKNAGIDVVALGRASTAQFQCDLANADRLTLPDADTLIHCAWALHLNETADIARVNIEGSKMLIHQATRAGIKRIIFISSLSAFEGARSKYGQSKLLVEKEVLKAGGVVIRPGLVFADGSSGGMVGSLEKLAALFPILPMVGLGGQHLYWCHREDLGRLIVALVQNGTSSATFQASNSRIFIAASPVRWRFAEIVRHLGKKQGRNIRLFVPIPPLLIWAGLRSLERAGVRPPFRSDSLISLLNQDPDPDFAPVRRLGIRFRDFA